MEAPQEIKKAGIAYPVSLVISHKQDKPILEIRKSTSDTEVIKAILSCAFNNTPLIVQPTFSDRFKAISSLLDKGVIYAGDDGNYYFTF